MKNLFSLGKSTFALIPGLLVIFYNLWLPPEIPRMLLSGIIESIGVFTLIVFYQQRKRFSRQPWPKLKGRGILFFSIFFISLIAYILIYDLQVIYNSKYDVSILIPFWKGNDLRYMIDKAGSVDNAILTYGPEAIRQAINDNKLTIGLTEIIFILTYISISEFLTLAFGFIAAKNGDR